MCLWDCSCFRLLLRLRGTVICRIWYQVIICALWSAGVVYMYKHFSEKYQGFHFHINPQSLQVAAVVSGLLLVFRTNTAYDRFWEGRKVWSEISANLRTLVRTFWVYVNDKGDPSLLVEKISILNLMIAFAYATKHYIREEYSYEEDDLREFIGHLPRMFIPTANQPMDMKQTLSSSPPAVIKQRQEEAFKRMEENQKLRPPETGEARQKEGCSCGCGPRGRKKRRSANGFVEKDYDITTNIPLEITYYLTSYIVSVKERALVDNPICRVLDTALSNLLKELNSLERIRRTPIPLPYAVHLHHVVWILVLVFPFQYTKELGWMTVPAATILSFSMLGILSIAREIENPFGYDFNDLNLEDYCKNLHKEVMCLISKPMPPPAQWIHTDKNRPILTDYNLTAVKLSSMSYEEVLRTLKDGHEFDFAKSSVTLYKSGLISATKPVSNTANVKDVKDVKVELPEKQPV